MSMSMGMGTATLQIPSALSAPTFRTSVKKSAAFKLPVHLHHAQHPSPGQGRRGWTVVRRAGPSTSSYIFALALPLSLVIFTVFTSIRIADKLDSDYLEELELNQAIMEAQGIEYEEDEQEEPEAEEDELQLPIPSPSPAALAGTRIRNRPKRQV